MKTYIFFGMATLFTLQNFNFNARPGYLLVVQVGGGTRQTMCLLRCAVAGVSGCSLRPVLEVNDVDGFIQEFLPWPFLSGKFFSSNVEEVKANRYFEENSGSESVLEVLR